MKYDEGTKNIYNLGPGSGNSIEHIELELITACENAILEISSLLHSNELNNQNSIENKDYWQLIEQADHLEEKIRKAQKILQGSKADTQKTESTGSKLEMDRIILEAREAERRKIARDIHDGPAQLLAAILLNLNLLTAGLHEADDLKLKQQLFKIQDIAEESIKEIRQILYDLKPAQLKNNLLSTLKDFFAEVKIKFGLEIDFQTIGVPQYYPIYIQTALLRLVQEALNNIRKHAGVNKANIVLSESEEMITLAIKDEGCGFEMEKGLCKSNSYGILGMQERIELLGGTFNLSAKPGSGTQILIEIPLKGRHYIGESKSFDSR